MCVRKGKDGYEKNDGKKKKRRLKVHIKQYT